MSKGLEALNNLVQSCFNPCDSDEVLNDKAIVEKSLKALEIIKGHIKFEDRGIEKYTDDFKNLVTKFLIRLESKDTGATFHIHLDTEEEFNLLKEVLE